MNRTEYHDSDFSMRARFYIETKCHRETRKSKKNGRKTNRVVRSQDRSRRRVK